MTVQSATVTGFSDTPAPAHAAPEALAEALSAQPDPCAEAPFTERVRQAGARLAAALRSLLTAWTDTPLRASDLGRRLAVDRSVAQRILAGVRQTDGLSAVSKLPGVEGLRIALRAFRRGGADQGLLHEAELGLAALADLIQEAGGSHTQLLSAIGTDVPGQSDKAHERTRAGLFRYASELTGRCAQVHVAIYVLRPNPGDPRWLDAAQVRGAVGLMRLRQAMPVVYRVTSDTAAGPEAQTHYTFDGRPIGGTIEGLLLQAFCSQPLPAIETYLSGSNATHVLDLNAYPIRSPIDVLLGSWCQRFGSTPQPPEDPSQGLSTVVVVPARHLLFDAYVHRSLALRSIVSLDGYFLAGQQSWRDPTAQWLHRLPGFGGPRQLNGSPEAVATPLYARQPELTKLLFSAVDWPYGDFVGFRCEMRYPPWSSQVSFTFDFSRP